MSLFTEEVIADQKRELPVYATKENVAGGTYIVTGANSGLGLEAAKRYVALGASKVVMAVRNVAAGEKAKADIEAATATSGIAEVWALDLASYDSVKAFAKRAEGLRRIDALIENAGVALDRWTLAEGHESTITINVYSTFLLAILLLPKLRESTLKFGILPHLVIVSSGAAVMAKDVFMSIKDDPLAKLDDEKSPGMAARYPLSKLCEIYAARYLATLIPVSKTGVVLNCLDPGLCYTNLTGNVSPDMQKMIDQQRVQFHGRTAEMGSRTLLHAAVAGKESHGRLVGSCEIKEHQIPGWVKDEEGQVLQKRVWDGLAKELDRVVPGCVGKALS